MYLYISSCFYWYCDKNLNHEFPQSLCKTQEQNLTFDVTMCLYVVTVAAVVSLMSKKFYLFNWELLRLWRKTNSVMNQILSSCSMERRSLQVFSVECQVFWELYTVAVQLIWSSYLLLLIFITLLQELPLEKQKTRQDFSTHSMSDFKVHSPARPLIRCS